MAATPVTPIPGINSTVASGGSAVTAVNPAPNGGFITNPATASETLYVNPAGTAGLNANGTTFGLAPGQTWTVIPGQTTATSVNAATSGHQFSVVSW